MIRGAIFDIDGTLLDSMWVWPNIGAKYLRSQGKEPDADLADVLETLALQQVAEHFRTYYHVGKSDEEILDDIIGMVADFYANDVQPKPGVLEFLRLLKSRNIPFSVATSSDKGYLMKALERIGLADSFEKILTCRDLNTDKWKPDIYIEASASFGCAREEIYVFEDAIHAATTARGAGFHVIGVYDDSAAKDEAAMRALCDAYITDFTQLSLSDKQQLLYNGKPAGK